MARERQNWPCDNLGTHYAGLARRPKPEPPMSEEHLKRVRVAMEERDRRATGYCASHPDRGRLSGH